MYLCKSNCGKKPGNRKEPMRLEEDFKVGAMRVIEYVRFVTRKGSKGNRRAVGTRMRQMGNLSKHSKEENAMVKPVTLCTN